MKKALFPGSFDPITNGHLDIIRRSAKLFDEVVVMVTQNPNKSSYFTLSERLEMIKNAVQAYSNVRVVTHDGLSVKYALDNGIGFLIRGIRDTTDFHYERELENNNSYLAPNIETIYLSSSSSNLFIRSSSVKEFLSYGVNVESFVPKSVIDVIERKKDK